VIRAWLSLAAAAGIWFAEGFVFSQFLAFRIWQVALMGAIYALFFVVALTPFRKFAGSHSASAHEVDGWRLLSAAPMMVIILGSFISLPILLAIVALGRVV
jgi:hypothetical protein